jgi:diguanylate cyclase (GGDEF)-like protein/PAS domain S-box-containing protein
VEAQLAEERERHKLTLESIGDGVISTDLTATVTLMNPVAEQLTGWNADIAIGKPVEDVFNVFDEVTGRSAIDPVLECLKGGQARYLHEGSVLESRLGERRFVRQCAAAVRKPDGNLVGGVLVFQDITHSQSLKRDLAHSAMHDSLTGLPNRSAFESKLTEALEQARREGREHALCFIDLDRFKRVNDKSGHAAGDALLRDVAQVIRKGCRSQDFAARIGGDEFALLLSDCPLQSAMAVAQKMVAAIEAARFSWLGEHYRIGASIGVTAVTEKSVSVEAVTREADTACYAAKRDGRGRVVVYKT